VRIFVRLVHCRKNIFLLPAPGPEEDHAFFSFLFYNNHEQFFLSLHEEANMPGVRSRDERCKGRRGRGVGGVV
jgi:hypothetical protein